MICLHKMNSPLKIICVFLLEIMHKKHPEGLTNAVNFYIIEMMQPFAQNNYTIRAQNCKQRCLLFGINGMIMKLRKDAQVSKHKESK